MAEGADRLWVDSMAAAYEQWLVPAVFRPFALDLGRRVSACRPRRILELAAGTGVLTRVLVSEAESSETVATDFNAAMVDLGRRQVPQATWRQADAMELPFDDGAFDLVACQFGVMFFPDKPAAFAEVSRILAPGGTLMFNTWASLESHQFQASLVAALTRVFPEDPPTFIAAVPHGYADPDVVLNDLRAGGFGHVTVETVTLEGRASSAADIAAGYCNGTPLRAAIEARTDLASATRAITRELEAQLGLGEVTGRMTAYVYEATTNA